MIRTVLLLLGVLFAVSVVVKFVTALIFKAVMMVAIVGGAYLAYQALTRG